MIQAPPVIELNALTAGWQLPVVGPLSLKVHPGEVLGIKGPNGCGKSTILAAISGAAKVFEGTVALRANSQIVIQTQHQPPLDGIPLTGHELLDLTDSPTEGLPAWLADRLNLRVDRLSGGQRQYLALWAVLNAPADLILLDEPSNNLDAAGRLHLANAIRQRAQRGAGIILVSHENHLLKTTCDRCIDLSTQEYQDG